MVELSINNHIRVITLWCLTIICMILHFNYHMSELMYGIDIQIPDTNGSVPSRVLIIRTAFHFLPLLYIVTLMWLQSKSIRVINLILSIVYGFAHLSHAIMEVKNGKDPSQIILLSVTAIIAVSLIYASIKWNKEKSK